MKISWVNECLAVFVLRYLSNMTRVVVGLVKDIPTRSFEVGDTDPDLPVRRTDSGKETLPPMSKSLLSNHYHHLNRL